MYGEELFSFVFGAGWIEAGALSSWLGLMYFFSLLHRPVVAYCHVFRLLRIYFYIELFFLFLRIMLPFFAYSQMNYQDAEFLVAVFSFVGISHYFSLILLVAFKARKSI